MKTHDARIAISQLIRDLDVQKEDIERFIDPEKPSWAKFDSELGYVLQDCQMADGIDGSLTSYRYGHFGERLQINYADSQCRINTYGNSFTQCHQVSDGETWQEYLAAHIGEPIRNFGVGGHGVYQAVSRLYRTEELECGASNIMLNIYIDDHYRSLDAYRLLRVRDWWRNNRGYSRVSVFHSNPWNYARLTPDAQGLTRHTNLCPTPDSLFNLCDPDWLTETLSDDLVLLLLAGFVTGDFSFLANYEETASALGVQLKLNDPASSRNSAREFYDRYAFRVSKLLLKELGDYLRRRDKHLLVILSYPAEDIAAACEGQARRDAHFLTELRDLPVGNWIDSLELHETDFRSFGVSGLEYARRYLSGHYNPAGCHFFAYAIKSRVVQFLAPLPPAYDDPGPPLHYALAVTSSPVA